MIRRTISYYTGWFSDKDWTVYSKLPFLTRGGSRGGGQEAGIFNGDPCRGNDKDPGSNGSVPPCNWTSFRVVLAE